MPDPYVDPQVFCPHCNASLLVSPDECEWTDEQVTAEIPCLCGQTFIAVWPRGDHHDPALLSRASASRSNLPSAP